MLKWLAAAAATGVVLPLALVLLVTANPATSIAGTSTADGPSVLALTDIPPTYLAWYMGAARTCPGLPWGVLAGIGKVESDHGQSTAPGVRSGANFAGAEGPMQFEPATFARYATDGDHDGQLSPYDPGDAIYTAASMLCANGAASGTPAGIRQAVFAYNHSWAYVDESCPGPPATPSPLRPAPPRRPSHSRCARSASPTSGARLGRTPTTAPAWSSPLTPLRASVSPGRRSAGAQDGPTVPLTAIEPGDLLFSAGSDGTNADPGHVVMYLGGGQIIQAPQTGEDVQIDPLSLAGVVVATRPADLPHAA